MLNSFLILVNKNKVQLYLELIFRMFTTLKLPLLYNIPYCTGTLFTAGKFD